MDPAVLGRGRRRRRGSSTAATRSTRPPGAPPAGPTARSAAPEAAPPALPVGPGPGLGRSCRGCPRSDPAGGDGVIGGRARLRGWCGRGGRAAGGGVSEADGARSVRWRPGGPELRARATGRARSRRRRRCRGPASAAGSGRAAAGAAGTDGPDRPPVRPGVAAPGGPDPGPGVGTAGARRTEPRGRQKKEPRETIRDPVLAEWLYGGPWVAENGPRASTFHRLESRTSVGPRAWLVPLTSGRVVEILESVQRANRQASLTST